MQKYTIVHDGARCTGVPKDLTRGLVLLVCEYGSDEGPPELRTALLDKLRTKNQLDGVNPLHRDPHSTDARPLIPYIQTYTHILYNGARWWRRYS